MDSMRNSVPEKSNSTPLIAMAAILGAVSVLGVGFTRVCLGVHWLSDVVGGWLIGAALVAVSAAAYGKWGANRPQPADGA
ncbi:hypothetical protein A8W25_02175 [Streptomyces sp. ERV7]|nr:hypothetical protein A8W25_02175 [Streptomyces sp. ERV7]